MVFSFFSILLFGILSLFPLQDTALELNAPISHKNSQMMSLLTANYSVTIPHATGGPFYEENSDVLVAHIGNGNDGFKRKSVTDSNGISIYVVKKGDTLSQIAEDFDVSVNTIKWENKLHGNTLKVGQELRILPTSGVMHTIRKGDTLLKIAKKYKVEVKDITVYNDIDETALVPGKKIIVPNGIITNRQPASHHSTRRVSKSYTKKVGGSAQRGYYRRPTTGIITSRFGPRHGSYHYGIDFGGYRGAPIVASASGTVVKVVYGCSVRSWRCGGGYGNNIVIQHSNGTRTRYAHLSKVIVRKGGHVVQGQKIGAIGNTGNVRPRPRSSKSTAGTHLHFEIIKANGQKMNPNKLF